MKHAITIYFLAILSFVLISLDACKAQQITEDVVKVKSYVGEVKDSSTAVQIAVANWYSAYGKKIFKYQIIITELNKENVWVVFGFRNKKNQIGGGPIIELEEKTARVVRLGWTR